jgi:TIR domain
LTDIFLSYANADRESARVIVDALKGRGWGVFWDRGIPPGTKWHDVLRKELYRANCVLVLLTRASLDSSWVSFEASVALQRDVLVPILLDVQLDPQQSLPEMYRDIHVSRLEVNANGPTPIEAHDTWLLRIADIVKTARLRRAIWTTTTIAVIAIVAGATLYVAATYHNVRTMWNADLWHVERGAYSREENDRLKASIRDAELIELLVPNANGFTTAFREDLAIFFKRKNAHMKVIFADGKSEFYNSMMSLTSGAVALDAEASASDKALPARSKQLLIDFAKPDAQRIDFRRFNTEFRLPLILIDRRLCFVTVRLTPDQSTESLRLEFVDTSAGTSTLYEKLGSAVRRIGGYLNPKDSDTGYVESCKRHFDAVWNRSVDFK